MSLFILWWTVKTNVSFTLQMSSRSHCVLTLYIERRTGIRTLQDVTVAKLNLVDLAGNERVKKTSDYRGCLRREAMAINKSLTFLEQVLYPLQTQKLGSQFHQEYKHLGQNRASYQLELLPHKKFQTVMCGLKLSLCPVEPIRMLTRHIVNGEFQTVYALRLGQGYIPFRQSRLTTLLKESLGGNCKTILIVCAWPEDYFLDETVMSHLPLKHQILAVNNTLLNTK